MDMKKFKELQSLSDEINQIKICLDSLTCIRELLRSLDDEVILLMIKKDGARFNAVFPKNIQYKILYILSDELNEMYVEKQKEFEKA